MAAIDMLDRFLETKHCTLWGIKKDIVDPKGRREAAAWLKRTIEDFYEFNSGCRIQLVDGTHDVDTEHLLAEHKALVENYKTACLERDHYAGLIHLVEDDLGSDYLKLLEAEA